MKPNPNNHAGNAPCKAGRVGRVFAASLAIFVLTALVCGPISVNLIASPAMAQAKKKKKQDEQQNKQDEQNADDPNAEKPQDNGLLPPLYDDRMMRLSELLGSLHYLRTLCKSGEGQLWRDEMNDMIAAEKPSNERKAKMIAQFNKGFRSYQEVYRECTPAAVEASNRYVREGIKITTEIPSRYGN